MARVLAWSGYVTGKRMRKTRRNQKVREKWMQKVKVPVLLWTANGSSVGACLGRRGGCASYPERPLLPKCVFFPLGGTTRSSVRRAYTVFALVHSRADRSHDDREGSPSSYLQW
jgi:hypothetical protein